MFVFQMAGGAIRELIKSFEPAVFHDIHVRSIQVLKKRANGIKPCNNSIRDNDNTTLQAATDSIRCITSYWRHFVNTTYNNHFLACDRTDQYNEIASLLLNNSEIQILQMV